jgi:long-chain acyl-CoA synthetase
VGARPCAKRSFGIWQPYSYLSTDHHRRVRRRPGGPGPGPGDIIVIIGDNRPEWLWAQLAIQSLGGMSLGPVSGFAGDEIGYVFELSEAKMVVAEDQEQVDKILSIARGCPACWNTSSITTPRGWDRIRRAGAQILRRDPRIWASTGPMNSRTGMEGSPQTTRPSSPPPPEPPAGPSWPCSRTATSWPWPGTWGWSDPKRADDEFVSFLPLAWMGEQMMAVSSALLVRILRQFPEEPDTVQRTSARSAPISSSPRRGSGRTWPPRSGCASWRPPVQALALQSVHARWACGICRLLALRGERLDSGLQDG